MTAGNPTDQEIRDAFARVHGSTRFETTEGQAAAARAVAARLIEQGWTESVDEAAHRVGVEMFGWRWVEGRP
jgi:hypothetical protein